MALINVFFVFAFVSSIFLLDFADGKSPKKAAGPIIDAPLLNTKIVTNRTFMVDVNGQGDFKSVQEAVDAVPAGNPSWVIIHLRKGVWREKVHIPKDKPYIFMRGNGRHKSTVIYSESSSDNYESAVLTVEAPHFVAFGINFKNDALMGEANSPNNRSLATFVDADMVAFYHCGFYSTHNAISTSNGRHYYEHCYVQGSVDVISGNGQAVFHDTEVFVIDDHRDEIHGTVMSHVRTSANDKTGFVFINGKIYGVDDVLLGAPVGDFSRAVYSHTYMSKAVRPEGWTTWHHTGSTKNLYQAEYKCTGPGAALDGRVPWSKKLTDAEVVPFLSIDFINGKEWLPAWLA